MILVVIGLKLTLFIVSEPWWFKYMTLVVIGFNFIYCK